MGWHQGDLSEDFLEALKRQGNARMFFEHNKYDCFRWDVGNEKRKVDIYPAGILAKTSTEWCDIPM